MAIEEVDQGLWEMALDNVTKQQETAFEALLLESVDAHLADDECECCKGGISESCEEELRERIDNRQEEQFDDEVEAEYDRLVELREESETD